ncbi:MAG: restriction endonuclease subunit S [Gammaproteobacteria bacterium]|nr:MAG: restriction endonuclease subunit S [Gammaproteobacteria bacterium]
MKEWQYYKLDELGTVRRGRSRHRPRNAPHLYGGKYPFVQTADIKAANLYLTSYTQTYSEAGLAQSKLWEPGTLCITIAANIADTAILGIPACFPDSVIGFTPYEGKSDARYIKYYFDIFQKTFQQISQGATQDNLSAEKLLSMKIPAPPLPTQQKIASILSAYDDLIENNLKRIKLLEEMTQITYEEWFVRMRFPGYESVSINLSNGLPEGWELLPFEDLVDFKEGPGLRNWQYRNEGIPFLNIRVIKDGDVDLQKVQYLHPEEVHAKYQHFLLQENDHVISTSGTLGRLTTIRKCHLPLCLNTSLIRMRKKNERYGTWLIKHMLSSGFFQNKCK